jgi:release factor glutamine methyltransferase
MAEQVIKAVKRQQTEGSSTKILDICTGSGCLALAVAREFPDGTMCGTDISEIALDYAHLNAEINRIRNVSFLKGSLFQPFEEMGNIPCQPVQFDFIISNPPYIQRDEIKELQPEVKNWEPVVALDGGQDGLDFFRELIPASKRFLNRNGIIMFELGEKQSDRVADLLVSEGFHEVETVEDYAGIERFIKARCRKY